VFVDILLNVTTLTYVSTTDGWMCFFSLAPPKWFRSDRCFLFYPDMKLNTSPDGLPVDRP